MSKEGNEMKVINAFKSSRPQKATAVLFLAVIFVMTLGLIFSARGLAGNFITDYRTTVPPGTSAFDRVLGATKSLERAVNESLHRREDYINLYGLIQKVMGKDIIADAGYGHLYRTKYGQITFAVPEQDIAPALEGIALLKEELDKEGIPLLYVQAPFKLPPHEQQLPQNVTDHANENVDRFLEGLDAAGIDYLDLRENYWSKGLDQNRLFFNTDHHWTINGAFNSYQEIAETLNRSFGFHIEERYTDLNQYDQEVFKDYYIGSMGRRVGRAFGGIDDFTLITPKFDTNYTIYERDSGEEKVFEGSFREALLTNSYLAPGTPPDTNRYAVYHGDNAELQFINHNVEEGKLLMVKDSFGLPVYSFLSTGIHEVRALDVRLFEESVAEYAREYRPDAVMILYNTDCFGGSMFHFQGK